MNGIIKRYSDTIATTPTEQFRVNTCNRIYDDDERWGSASAAKECLIDTETDFRWKVQIKQGSSRITSTDSAYYLHSSFILISKMVQRKVEINDRWPSFMSSHNIAFYLQHQSRTVERDQTNSSRKSQTKDEVKDKSPEGTQRFGRKSIKGKGIIRN